MENCKIYNEEKKKFSWEYPKIDALKFVPEKLKFMKKKVRAKGKV